MRIPPQYENHESEWRDEANRRRLGLPEDEEADHHLFLDCLERLEDEA